MKEMEITKIKLQLQQFHIEVRELKSFDYPCHPFMFAVQTWKFLQTGMLSKMCMEF